MHNQRSAQIVVVLGLFVMVLIANRVLALVTHASQLHAPTQAFTASVASVPLGPMNQWPGELVRVIWQVAALSVLLFIGTPGPRSGKGPSA